MVRKHPPTRRTGDELILKLGCECSSAYKHWLAPSVFILGNRGGFRWLSAYFEWIAGRITERAEFSKGDPTDHQHINLDFQAPINSKLSDELGIMVGSYSQKHRRRVFKCCGISQSSRQLGSPITQFRRSLDFIVDLLINGYPDEEMRQQTISELKILSDHISDQLVRLQASDQGQSVEGR